MTLEDPDYGEIYRTPDSDNYWLARYILYKLEIIVTKPYQSKVDTLDNEILGKLID